jgi:exosortase A-associated hydrolase 2
MNTHHGRLPAASFFLEATPGKRFCIYHAPHPGGVCRGGFIFVHPFADEMNRSRRMVALQARQFAALGYAVLLIDFFGCGDSTGESGEATWDIWKADLALAKTWLENKISAPVGLWGLRLGALLALDFAQEFTRNSGNNPSRRITSLILWNPVISGISFMTQFLRLRLGNDMFTEGPRSSGVRAMREALQDGATLEVAGIDISPALAATIDALHAETLWIEKMPVYWLEVVRAGHDASLSRMQMPPATIEVFDEWRRHAVDLHFSMAPGLPFWATQELSTCPELLAMTSALLIDTLLTETPALPL